MSADLLLDLLSPVMVDNLGLELRGLNPEPEAPTEGGVASTTPHNEMHEHLARDDENLCTFGVPQTHCLDFPALLGSCAPSS